MNERRIAIVARREAGESFKSIALSYGVTGAAVNQQYHKACREKRRKEDMVEVVCDDTPIENALDVPIRAINALRNENVRTIGDLRAKTEAQLLRFPNFFLVSLGQVVLALREKGIELRRED
jgi:DNA-directed RNA polymerase alpha subunit